MLTIANLSKTLLLSLAISVFPVHAADSPGAGLQTLLDDGVKSGIPGISAAIANSDGLLWEGTAGSANLTTGEPVQKHTLFGIGSITKTFIAVVTLQLVEEGRLSLNQTPQDILGADVVGSVAGADTATLAQLLNHTSGIPTWEEDPVWIKDGRGAKQDPSHIWGRKEALPYISETPVTNAPGEAFSYSNTNHTLLGLVIEKVTGNDAVSEIKARILAPLGLSEIYLEGFQPVPKGRVAGRYHYNTPEFREAAGVHQAFAHLPPLADGEPAVFDASASNLSVEWTAGGMVATAGDLARYFAAFRAEKLLEPASMAVVKDWFPITQKIAVGHGLFRRETEGGYTVVGHTGGVLGFSAAAYWFEDRDIIVVVLSNIGVMHVGKRPPNGAALAYENTFISTAAQLPPHNQQRHSSLDY